MPNLREQITSHFNKNELQNLCYDLSINYEELPGDTLSAKVRGLIEYCQRHGQNKILATKLANLRPNVNWEYNKVDMFQPLEAPPPVERNFFVGHVYNQKLIDDLREAISRATKGTPWKPIYADEQVISGHILFDKIAPLIAQCEFSIFEISNKTRPNIFIELGIALQQGKPVYLLLEDGLEPPSDLAGRDRITYRSYKELSESLRQKVFSQNPTILVSKLLRHTYHVNTLSVSINRAILASGSGDRNVFVWDLKTENVRSTFKHNSWVGSVAFSQYSPILATSDGKGIIRLWDINTSEMRKMQQAHDGACRTIAFSPNEQILASGGGDQQIHLWRFPDLDLVMTLSGHESEVRRLAFSPDGEKLASCGEDGNLFLWSLSTRDYKPVLQNPNNLLRSVAYAHNGSFIAATDSIGNLWIAKENSRQTWQIKTIKAHEGPSVGLAIHPSDQLIATGGQDKLINLWDVQSGKRVSQIKGHTDTVTCLSYAFGGKWLISGSRDKSVCLWEV